jgi:hypothetical protein
VTSILDMRKGKHNLRFVVDDALLPYVIINIPDENMHIGVFFFLDNFFTFIIKNIYDNDLYSCVFFYIHIIS